MIFTLVGCLRSGHITEGPTSNPLEVSAMSAFTFGGGLVYLAWAFVGRGGQLVGSVEGCPRLVDDVGPDSTIR